MRFCDCLQVEAHWRRSAEGVLGALENNKHFHGWRLTRRDTKAAKNLLSTTGSVGAAEKLLRHSIAYGHSRLVVRRYLLARALGATGLDAYKFHFIIAVKDLTEAELDKAERDVMRRARALLKRDARHSEKVAPPP